MEIVRLLGSARRWRMSSRQAAVGVALGYLVFGASGPNNLEVNR